MIISPDTGQVFLNACWELPTIERKVSSLGANGAMESYFGAKGVLR